MHALYTLQHVLDTCWLPMHPSTDKRTPVTSPVLMLVSAEGMEATDSKGGPLC